MKAAGIVILFPLISVVIVSLYVHGGISRIAALVLLVGSVVGGVAALIWKRPSDGTSTDAFPPDHHYR
jgi:hypothetical protein